LATESGAREPCHRVAGTISCASRSPVEYKSDGAKIDWVHTTLDEPLDREAQRLHHDLRGAERWRVGIQQPVEGTRRNRGGARAARNLQGEILIAVGGVVCLCGLSHTERQRLVPFRGERRGIHSQEEARTESAPYQSKCDRCGRGAADQCRQLTRGNEVVRRNGTLDRQ
jgi:hypothetical protein